MAIKDLLKNIIPQDVNIFGAGLPSYAKYAQNAGLITQDQINAANKRSLFQGLLGMGASYLSQPKNQGYGSIIPYLAKAYGSGMQMAQNPYQQLGQELMYKKQFDEFAREQKIRDLQKNLFVDQSITSTEQPTYSANAISAPIDASNQAGLAIGPDFTVRKPVTTTTTEQRIDPNVLKQISEIDLQAGANVMGLEKNLRNRQAYDQAKTAIDKFTQQYPEFEYLKNEPVADAYKFVQNARSPEAYKKVGAMGFYNPILKEFRNLGVNFDDEDFIGERGTFQQAGFAIDTTNGSQYPVTADSRTGKRYIYKDGKKVFTKDLPETFQFRTTGDLNVGQLTGTQMNDLSTKITTDGESLRRTSEFLVRNSKIEKGLPKYLNMLYADMKTLLDANEGLTPAQLAQKLQAGEIQTLAGKNRLAIVGGGTMTEQDAARLMIALGGDPNTILQNPQVAEQLISNMLRDTYTTYNQSYKNYDIQLSQGNQQYAGIPKFNFNKQTINAMSPNVVLDLGLAKLPDMTNQQIVKLYVYNKDRFREAMLDDSVNNEERAKIMKILKGKE